MIQRVIPNEYKKPNLNNLPFELGIRIFNQIRRSSALDYKRLKKEADRLEKKMIEAETKK